MAVNTVGTVEQDASGEVHDRNATHWHGTKGDADYLSTRDQGEQVETLWESGKTIRHLTQEEGQGT